jgi:hypothetical protein
MDASDVFLAIALICAGWGVVSAMFIVSFLQSRGIKINWLLIKLWIIKYVSQYEEITRKETGKAGAWYFSYVISMLTAFGMAVVGIILKWI